MPEKFNSPQRVKARCFAAATNRVAFVVDLKDDNRACAKNNRLRIQQRNAFGRQYRACQAAAFREGGNESPWQRVAGGKLAQVLCLWNGLPISCGNERFC
jgi:hypothetical protein